MWVNELRLLNPESSVDWSAIGSAELKLADVGTIIGTFSRSNPNFHRLEERFGNRIQSTNFSIQMQGTLEKFLPNAFKETKLPISYTHYQTPNPSLKRKVMFISKTQPRISTKLRSCDQSRQN